MMIVHTHVYRSLVVAFIHHPCFDLHHISLRQLMLLTLQLPQLAGSVIPMASYVAEQRSAYKKAFHKFLDADVRDVAWNCYDRFCSGTRHT
jgi:hypothetical protein